MNTEEKGKIEVGYIPEMDRTVIFLEKENSTELIGWYYGAPTEKTTNEMLENESPLIARYEI